MQDSATLKKSTEVVKSVLKTTIIRPSIYEEEKQKQAQQVDARPESKAMEEDPFAHNYDRYQAIVPPFDLYTLSQMPEQAGEMTPALDAMSVNIEKLGQRIVPRPGVQARNEETPPDILGQIAIVRNFFDNAVLDQEDVCIEELRSRVRKDLETTGNAYIEVIPKLNEPNVPAGLKHLPSWTMRIRKLDEESTKYEVPRAIQDKDGNWSMKDFPTSKRFRRFIQIRESGARAVYFKEWGDPRSISFETGLVAKRGKFRPEEAAHEVIHLKLYSTRSPYGLPRWIGHLFAIYGTRAAEEINYVTFENNQIPALALLATNVAVTQGSIDRMKEFIEERVQGNKNYATIVLIEGEPIGEGMRDPGAMKLDIKPLTEFQHSDAMFQNYIAMNNALVRRSWRLPPILVGYSDDYNRATAEASLRLAEQQIFAPERKTMDTVFTNTLIARLRQPSVMFKSNTPNVTDNFELTQLLATAEHSGGLTPRISNQIVGDVLGSDIPEVASEVNPDLPFTLTMERERAKLESEFQPLEQTKFVNKSEATDLFVTIIEKNNKDDFLSDRQRATIARFLQQLASE